MDPITGFSTAAAAIGLTQQAVALVEYVRQVKAAIDTIDEDVEALIKELEALEALQGRLQDECNRQSQRSSVAGQRQRLWFYVEKTMRLIQEFLKKFAAELKGVYGANPKQQGFRDAFMKQHRLRSQAAKFQAWRNTIQQQNGIIQMLLQMILIVNQDHFQEENSKQTEALQKSINSIRTSLDDLFLSRGSAFDPLAYASFLKDSSTSVNTYFDTSQPVQSSYVGREEESKRLATAFFSRANGELQMQKRFVIYGVGGSGKTQFCCKFAQDYQYLFWGVFCIDGRSHDRLQQSLVNIAVQARAAPNYSAALHWLSNQDKRWLLIIDNADDPAIDLYDYFPKGGRGYILITTRNPSLQALGNVSPGHLEFKGLLPSDARTLLFKTSGHPPSRADELGTVAGKILDQLGYLALAINIAGSAIREGFCKFQDYLTYFEEMSMERIRKLRRPLIHASDDFEEKRERSVESAFDVSLRAIQAKPSRESRDALQLLKTFAFMHCEYVHLTFLEGCVLEPSKEEKVEAENKERDQKTGATPTKQTWSQFFQEVFIRLLTVPRNTYASTTLPDVLREGRAKRIFDKNRIRKAMKQLTQYSLAMHDDQTDSWSMHPLVHKWARESLSTSIAEQYVWCECAATLLASCVVIGGENSDELMRHLVPHVDQVRKYQSALEERTRHERMARLKPWPIFETGFSPQRVRMMAKFSIVYAHNGSFGKAEALQRAVQHFMVDVLGFGNEKTRLITMALADTLWQLGLSDDSARLLEVLLDNCLKTLGPDHPDTFVAKRRLAHSRMMQGRVADAKRLYEDAMPGLEKYRGLEDDETLEAMDGIGMTIMLSGTPAAIREARRIHKQTWDTRRRTLGPTNLRTTESGEKFYVAAWWWHADKDDLVESVKGLTEIKRIREENLGPENPYTLLAKLSLARILSKLQEYEEAEKMLKEGLAVAERTLGPNHVGVLYGRYHLGNMRVAQARYTEARDILVDVTARQRHSLQGWGRFHYDRISALVSLAKAHQELGEFDQCDEAVAEVVRGFDNITTKKHPWQTKLLRDWEEWKSQRPPLASPTSPTLYPSTSPGILPATGADDPISGTRDALPDDDIFILNTPKVSNSM